jgi:pimeloyl-ACP methyl ester carboxylesterase
VQTWRDIHFSARDGLRLYARHYPAPGSTRRPVLCLAGLTRNGRDFHRLATRLSGSGEGARDVYTLDGRGRGRSAHDRDWRNYSLRVEADDALDFMTLAGLAEAAIVGTSRGGLIAMLIAVLRPCALAAAVLNDIGPVVEREGHARIAAHVGRIPLPADWEEAAQIVRELHRRQFPAVPAEAWAEAARASFDEVDGLPAPGCDPAIARTVSPMDGPMPELWPQFEALARVPVLAIRGQNSDVLSAGTLERMRARHPRLEALTVAGQGHAPFLGDAQTAAAIAAFLERSDGNVGAASLPVPALA